MRGLVPAAIEAQGKMVVEARIVDCAKKAFIRWASGD
jgi:hypothetical protein